MKLYQRIYTAYKKDGLRKIAKGCFDIIFLDCNLPDGTGFSFCVIICYQIFLPLYFPLSEFVNTGGTYNTREYIRESSLVTNLVFSIVCDR